MLALTAATAVVSFTYLGSLTAPAEPLDATNTTALTEQLPCRGTLFRCGSTRRFLRRADDGDGRAGTPF